MSPRKEFEVVIYESEYRQIQAWVDKYQHLETGGDLFGLWADDHTAVVQLVLGPGKGCRRSSVSFYQDVEYLDRVGYLLTHEEGLCHIGEWHSHHRLGLTRPSGGDENTVWNNMDRYGIHRFFLFIATIDYDWVNIGSFLFEIDSKTEKRKSVLKGRVTQISNAVESPFRVKVRPALATGAETQNSPKSLKKFAQKNAKIELEYRKNTAVSTRCHNEYPTTNTPIHEERENREKAKQQGSRDRFKNTEENPIEIQNNVSIEQKHYKVLDNQESEMPKSIQKENSKMDALPVLHLDRNNAETMQNQPLISQLNNEGDSKQNKSTSRVQSTQGYNEIKDQTNIKTRNNHDKPNDEDDQVQLTVLENIPKKAKMDATCNEIPSAKKSKVTYIESVKSSDLETTNQRDQTHKPNTLDQGEVSLRKETSQCKSQQNSKHESITVLENENKDDQPKERNRSSQICSGIEEKNSQYEPSSSVPDQDLDGEDELTVKCWPGRKQKGKKEKRKKEKEESKKEEKQTKKNEKEKKKKEKQERKKEEKQTKKNEKEKKKKEKQERKKEEKQTKKNEKEKKKKEKEESKKEEKQTKKNEKETKKKEKQERRKANQKE